MIKKEIKYIDLDGNPQIEVAYFNLSKAELMEREMLSNGSFSDELKKIADSENTSDIMKKFSEILEWAYGRRSEDGRRFIKKEEYWQEFKETPAYSEFIFELMTNGEYAAQFVNDLMPDDLSEEVNRLMSERGISEAEARSRASLKGHRAPQQSENEQRDQGYPEQPQKFQGYPGTPHIPEQ